MADGYCYIIVYFMYSYNINIMYVSDVIREAIGVDIVNKNIMIILATLNIIHYTMCCIATHILTLSATIPVTSTPLEVSSCITWSSPLIAALYILLFSSYSNITNSNHGDYIISIKHNIEMIEEKR